MKDYIAQVHIMLHSKLSESLQITNQSEMGSTLRCKNGFYERNSEEKQNSSEIILKTNEARKCRNMFTELCGYGGKVLLFLTILKFFIINSLTKSI